MVIVTNFETKGLEVESLGLSLISVGKGIPNSNCCVASVKNLLQKRVCSSRRALNYLVYVGENVGERPQSRYKRFQGIHTLYLLSASFSFNAKGNIPASLCIFDQVLNYKTHQFVKASTAKEKICIFLYFLMNTCYWITVVVYW